MLLLYGLCAAWYLQTLQTILKCVEADSASRSHLLIPRLGRVCSPLSLGLVLLPHIVCSFMITFLQHCLYSINVRVASWFRFSVVTVCTCLCTALIPNGSIQKNIDSGSIVFDTASCAEPVLYQSRHESQICRHSLQDDNIHSSRSTTASTSVAQKICRAYGREAMLNYRKVLEATAVHSSRQTMA